jgi:hypothetical protein
MTRSLVSAAAVAGLALAGVSASTASAARSCAPVKDPYAGTRYEGVDLTRITAGRVSCATARRVARAGHRRALGADPSTSGIVRVTWNGWRVRGDLRPASDRYVATKSGRTVRWRF